MARSSEPHFLRRLLSPPQPPEEHRPRIVAAYVHGTRPEEGTPSVFSTGRSYVQGRGEDGQGLPDISFNQEIKLLSSFKLRVHGRGPFIQLRFLGGKKKGQVRKTGEREVLARAHVPRTLQALSPRPAQVLAASGHIWGNSGGKPWPSLTRISGTFLFLRFSFTAGGEIPGRVVSGAQGFTGTLGASVNLEHTTGETWARSSDPSSPSKPKQDRRPGVEVEAEPKVSRRL